MTVNPKNVGGCECCYVHSPRLASSWGMGLFYFVLLLLLAQCCFYRFCSIVVVGSCFQFWAHPSAPLSLPNVDTYFVLCCCCSYIHSPLRVPIYRPSSSSLRHGVMVELAAFGIGAVRVAVARVPMGGGGERRRVGNGKSLSVFLRLM